MKTLTDGDMPRNFAKRVTDAVRYPMGSDWFELQDSSFEFLSATFGPRDGLDDAECERIDYARALAYAAFDWSFSQSDSDYVKMTNAYYTNVMLHGLR